MVVGGSGNHASGPNSFIAGGASAIASGDGSVVIGGYDDVNTASGYGAMVLSAGGGTASGEYSAVIGGNGAGVAAGYSSIVIGQFAAAINNGEVAIGGNSGQESLIPVGRLTEDATPTVLALTNTSTNSPAMPSSSVWFVEQTIVGMTAGAVKVATYKRQYTISRPSNEASTVILGSIQVVGVDTGTNGGVPPVTWAVAITANTDEGGPRTTVTGDVGDSIRWSSFLRINQVVYAP